MKRAYFRPQGQTCGLGSSQKIRVCVMVRIVGAMPHWMHDRGYEDDFGSSDSWYATMIGE